MSFEDAKKDLAEGIVNLILEKSNTIRYLIDNQEKEVTKEEPVAEVPVAENPVEEAPVAVQDIPGVMVEEQPALEGVKTSTLPDPMGQADDVEIMPGTIKIDRLKNNEKKNVLKGGNEIGVPSKGSKTETPVVETPEVAPDTPVVEEAAPVVEEATPIVEAPVEEAVVEATPEVAPVEAAPVEEPTIQPIENTVADLVGDAVNNGPVTTEEAPVKRL